MTTESATNRIDLDALSAALTAAGIPVHRETDWFLRINLHWWTIDVYEMGVAYANGVCIDGLVRALDIIKQHTSPRASARSRDQAGMAGAEETTHDDK